MLLWWYPLGVLQMAVCGHDCRNFWVFKFIWVRIDFLPEEWYVYLVHTCSDFFPVIITFLRQVPFVGTFLSLPYIRGVRVLS